MNSPTSKYSHLCAPFRSFKFLISRHKLLPYSVRNRRAVSLTLQSLVSHRISHSLFLPLAAVVFDSPTGSGRILCPRRARVQMHKKRRYRLVSSIRRRRDLNSPTSKYSHLCAPFRSFKFLISRHKLLPYSVRNRRAVSLTLQSLVSHRISHSLFLPLAAVVFDSPAPGSGRPLCPRRARVPSIKKEDTVWYLLIRRRRDLNSPTSKYSHLCAPFRSFKFLISRHKLLPSPAPGSGRILCPRRARLSSIKKEDTVWYLLIRRRRDLNSPTSKYSHLCAPFRSFKFLISRHKLLLYSVRNRRAVPPALPSLVSHRISRFLFLPLAAVTLDSPSGSGRILCPRRARVQMHKKRRYRLVSSIRRRRDLNPRAAQTTYTLSRGASSAT